MAFPSLIENFMRSRRKVLAVCFTLSLLMHLPFFNMPPRSTHAWRQCNTLAVARNFYEENMNILKPRVDRRLDQSGVTGMQFPAYEWVVAVFYKLFGFHPAISRLVSFAIFLFGIWAVYGLFHEWFQSAVVAAFAAWGFTWSPELFYHGINALPDVLALSASTGGFYFFLKWWSKQGGWHFMAALFLLVLAGLTKIQYLAVGFPIAIIVLRDFFLKNKSNKWFFPVAVLGVASLVIPLWWYSYAQQLIEQSGLRDFGLLLRPVDNLSEGVEILRSNLVSDLPELLLNYANFALFLTGVFVFFKFKKWKHIAFWPLLIWAMALIIYHFLMLNQMKVHEYYMLPHLPFLLVIAALGGLYLFQKQKWVILALLLLAQPVLAAVRIYPARWLKDDPGVPVELYEKESRQELISAVPNDSLCIAGPDESGCIYFYFLHKKGFGFSETSDLTKAAAGKDIPVIEDYIRRGATYLYTNDTTLKNHPEIRPYLRSELEEVGSFRVYRLVKK